MAHALAKALADAFMQVGIFVALLVVAFGWLRWRHGDRILSLAGRRGWAPVLCAVLGVSPGCAGAILVMPLFVRGTVPFGGVVAALVATMGDSSWVVMAADPVAALGIHSVLFVTGVVVGYVVDGLGISPGVSAAEPVPSGPPSGSPRRRTGRSSVGIAARLPQVAQRDGSLAVAVRTAEPATVAAFWLLAVGGSVVGVPAAFQLLDVTSLGTLAGPDPFLTLGVCGTAIAVVITVANRLGLADDSVASARATSAGQPFAAVLRHGAVETSFVVTWVAAIYVAWALVQHGTGFDGSQLPLFGWTGVILGAGIGLIPGCAVQIVFTGLYLSGAMPFSTLIANALSQDGDALLPLLAEQSRSALLATCITTVPGLLVGTLFLLFT